MKLCTKCVRTDELPLPQVAHVRCVDRCDICGQTAVCLVCRVPIEPPEEVEHGELDAVA